MGTLTRFSVTPGSPEVVGAAATDTMGLVNVPVPGASKPACELFGAIEPVRISAGADSVLARSGSWMPPRPAPDSHESWLAVDALQPASRILATRIKNRSSTRKTRESNVDSQSLAVGFNRDLSKSGNFPQ